MFFPPPPSDPANRDAPAYSGELDFTDFEQTNGQLGVGYRGDFGELRLRYTGWRNEHNFLLPPPAGQLPPGQGPEGIGQNLENDSVQLEARLPAASDWTLVPTLAWQNNLRQSNAAGTPRSELFDGTIAENIARLSDAPDDAKVVAAAKKAAAHQMILDLPNGYDTQIREGQSRLSGGQIQRIGLARALYNDPVIVVLDEPNSNLDNTGNQALNHAIRALKSDNRSVLIMAHRPNAIQECDTLLVMENGMRMAFGPKDEVLQATVRNHKELAANASGHGGVT